MMKSNQKFSQSKQTSLEGLQSVALKQQDLPLTSTVHSQESTKLEETGQKPTEDAKSRKGDLAEHYAITWLWDEGYEVFKNAGCSGPIDLIAHNLETQEILLIDVKTFQEQTAGGGRYSNTPLRSQLQKELNVVLLGFHPITRKLRFVNHRETK